MNYKKPLKISLIFFLLVSCEDNNQTSEKIIAQVGKAKLTKSELNSFLLDERSSKKYKEEFIKDWIEKEVLFQIANEKKLLRDDNFNRIINESQREIAAAISIKDYLDSHPIIYTEEDLKKFYNSNKDDFSFSTDAYILNLITFRTQESAINFRNVALENNWDFAVNNIFNSSDLMEENKQTVYKLSKIQSKKLLRVIKELFNEEISLVVETEFNNFVVVQMLGKIDESSTPQFNYIQEQVKQSYIFNSQKQMIRNYLDSLIIDRKVKVY